MISINTMCTLNYVNMIFSYFLKDVEEVDQWGNRNWMPRRFKVWKDTSKQAWRYGSTTTTRRGGTWACMRCPCLCLCWVWDGDYVSQLPYLWYYIGVKRSLNMLVRNANPRGHMCFMCLIFNLSGPCELLFSLCFLASWTWDVVSVMLYPCSLCVALLIYMFVLCVACLTGFVNCLVKQFAMCLGVVAILLLNVNPNCKHIYIYIYIYLLEAAHPCTTNSWHGDATLHTAHHKHTDFHQLQESRMDTIHGTPPYPPIYTLPTECLQTLYRWQTSTTYQRVRCIATAGSYPTT